VDSSQNVYIAGGNQSDYLTIKYVSNSVLNTGSQTWYLNHDMKMEKTGVQSGNVNIEGGSSITWISDQQAHLEVNFPDNGEWIIKLATTDWSGMCSAQIGDFNPVIVDKFTAFNTIPATGSYSNGLITITITTGGTISQNDYLALKIYNSDGGSSHIITTDGSSSLSSPTSDPGYPLPELSAGLLLLIGLSGLIGFLFVKRRKVNLRNT
jgi:hypothetical protein